MSNRLAVSFLLLSILILNVLVNCSPRTNGFGTFGIQSRSKSGAPVGKEPPQEPVFSAIWNVPTYQCLQFGVDLPLKDYNIKANIDGNSIGDVIALFPRAQLGLYPNYDQVTNKPINGGLPQLGNISLHLEKVVEDIKTLIPDPGYSGTSVIDWERWNLRWEQTIINIYRDKSIELVKARHPEWDSDLVEQIARLEFEQAAKAYVDSTLRLVKEMRPDARWGFYHYPYCHNVQSPDGQCDPVFARSNEEILWFFDSVTAIYPSIYLHEGVEFPRIYVKGCMDEAFRMRALSNEVHTPVLAYTRFNYSDTKFYYTKEDLNRTVLQAAEMGANGVIFWGDHLDTHSRQSCMELQSYLNTTLGPFVRDVTSAASFCSQRVCSRNGRCVGDILHCSSTAAEFTQTGMSNTCTCSCFRGWEGPHCTKKSQQAEQT